MIVNGTGLNLNINGQHIYKSKDTPKPFVLKLKATNIQSCRKDYDGSNDTLGLVVSRAERRLVYNLPTDMQFLGKESNSHYHAHKVCLFKADATFSGAKLVVAPDVKGSLPKSVPSCLGVPAEALGGVLPTS